MQKRRENIQTTASNQVRIGEGTKNERSQMGKHCQGIGEMGTHIQGAVRQHEKDYNTVLESVKPPVRRMKELRARNFEKMIKTMDHFERAKRELEVPLWTQF